MHKVFWRLPDSDFKQLANNLVDWRNNKYWVFLGEIFELESLSNSL